jgi:ABC-type antimicrobial peptide transport system permease subunit
VLATMLACIGLYGLLSYEVATRTRALGIRMALGARRRHLMKLVVSHGIFLSLGGVVLGMAGAFCVCFLGFCSELQSIANCRISNLA